MSLYPMPESILRQMADELGPESAAWKVLCEAEEIRKRGNVVRFCITDTLEFCVQEGVVLDRVDSSAQKK